MKMTKLETNRKPRHPGLFPLIVVMAVLSLRPASAQVVDFCRTPPPPNTVKITNNITTSANWAPPNTYILDDVIYVTNGATLTIQPGTVVRGVPRRPADPNQEGPGALVITRDAKIRALGTESQPIVFTDCLDDLGDLNGDGTLSNPDYQNKLDALSIVGKYGSLILLGRGYVANNTLSAPSAAREFQIEGANAAGELGFYGGCSERMPTPDPCECDDDDSGTLKYVSLRYGGFVLGGNNEINGLTLGGVGRETVVDYIDVFQNKDDGIEFFGGAASVKHVVIANVGDDSMDYDEGWRGKAQFYFAMQGIAGAEPVDKGGELDGGNAPDGSQPLATPTIYNATFIGLGAQKATYTRRTFNTGLHFRDNAGGRWYNSFFADFGATGACIESGAVATACGTIPNDTSWQRANDAYVVNACHYRGPASSFDLELQDNDFWCFGRLNASSHPVGEGDGGVFGCDTGKQHCNNSAFSNAALDNDYYACGTTIPIRARVRTDLTGDPSQPDQTTSIDPRPRPGGSLTTTDRVPPNDGFFMPASYKGAFHPNVNWAAGWTTMAKLGYFSQCNGTDATLSTPDEVKNLNVAPGGVITWTLSNALGTETFDVLKTTRADTSTAPNFNTPPSGNLRECVANDTALHSATDPDVPPVGSTFLYLVRAKNACGVGSLGLNSNGTERTGTICPL